ncbi:hypothetical protein B0H21DRAFT_888396 [Amylocystis lapponica]|nr:hypothetical protein B0H21DRAFT_888396 [Amylocystis lapponica]
MVKETEQEESEFVVEYILRAKVVVKKDKRRLKKQWLFWVKWQGYGVEDNTWEPVESFDGGSEHFITGFWERAQLDGREPTDLSEFAEGEEILPTGPPRGKPKAKKGKAKATNPAPPPEEIEDSEAEVKSLVRKHNPKTKTHRGADVHVDVESPVQKLKRGRSPKTEDEPTSSSSKLTRRRSIAESFSKPTSISEKRAASSSRKIISKRQNTSPSPVRESRKGKRRKLSRKESSPEETLVTDAPAVDADPATTEASIEGLVEATLGYPDSPAGSLFGGADDDERMEEVAPSQADEQSVDREEPLVALASSSRPSGLLNPEQAPAPPPRSQTPPPRAQPSIPYHRARAANPRIKLIEDPRLGVGYESAIATKAKLMRIASSSASTGATAESSTGTSSHGGPAPLPRRGRIASSKAGPGRSSGGFNGNGFSTAVASGSKVPGPSDTSVREKPLSMNGNHQEAEIGNVVGNGVETDNEMTKLGDVQESAVLPPAPPTAQELLQLAGLKDGDAEALGDFEEDAHGETDVEDVPFDIIPSVEAGPPAPESQSPAVVEKPAPVAHRLGAGWMRSTIFGPLGLGRDIPSTPAKEQEESLERPRSAIFLSLDSAVSLPVILLDVHPRGSFLDRLGKQSRGPPGKFYRDKFALDLLDSLRVEGSAARLSLDPEADERQKEHFKRFCTRLKEAELFLEMAGTALVAMCSSENQVLGQKLGMPSTLVGLADGVLVAHVEIVGYSAYADAAIHADDVRW